MLRRVGSGVKEPLRFTDVFVRFLIARRSASAVYARALCPSVRLSVTTSLCSIETAQRIEFVVVTEFSLDLSLTGNSDISKNKGTSVWHFVPNSPLGKFYFSTARTVDRRKCCQPSSTDDRCQFITLSVQLCVQHAEREAARRAGRSASAVACIC